MSLDPAIVPTILDFWFGSDDPAAEVPGRAATWFQGGEDFDAACRRRFLPTLQALARDPGLAWRDTVGGRLASIIVLDQLSRNIYRGTRQAFAQDAAALRLTLDGLDRGEDQHLGLHQRAFFYLPLEHSEDPAMQQRSITCYTALCDHASPDQRDQARSYLDYARRHKAIIDRFGRYPHRNEILGRTTTLEEFDFLRRPGSSF